MLKTESESILGTSSSSGSSSSSRGIEEKGLLDGKRKTGNRFDTPVISSQGSASRSIPSRRHRSGFPTVNSNTELKLNCVSPSFR